MPPEKIGVTFAELEGAYARGGTRRSGKIQVVDAIDNPYFQAYDFVVINVQGLYRMQFNRTTKEVILYRKVEQIETVTRWVPITDQNISKTVDGEPNPETQESGANGSVSPQDDASMGDRGHDGEGDAVGVGDPGSNSESSS